MSNGNSVPRWRIFLVGLTGAASLIGCAADPRSPDDGAVATFDPGGGTSSATDDPATMGDDGGGTGDGTSSMDSSHEGSGSSAGTTDESKFDVGQGGQMQCGGPDQPACCMVELPEHELLEAFLAAYPPASMPASHDAVTSFMPQADGHTMAWTVSNVGGEFIDQSQGGVIEENIVAGREVSKTAAVDATPMSATILEYRDEAVVIDDLGFGPGLGLGWAWGSLIFEDTDGSIAERVYLYVGYNGDGDSEAFFYSEDAVQLCIPPG